MAQPRPDSVRGQVDVVGASTIAPAQAVSMEDQIGTLGVGAREPLGHFFLSKRTAWFEKRLRRSGRCADVAVLELLPTKGVDSVAMAKQGRVSFLEL